jgi:CheY-like chemotaxis protein
MSNINSIDSTHSICNSNSISSIGSLNSIKEYIRVLIVDDSVVSSKILKRQLEKDNFYVDTITDGEDALILLQNNIFNYDLLIIDIFMPNMYGTTLIKRIRKELSTDIPIIAISTIPEFGEQALDLGANMFLEKGYSIDYLKNDIIDLILQ